MSLTAQSCQNPNAEIIVAETTVPNTFQDLCCRTFSPVLWVLYATVLMLRGLGSILPKLKSIYSMHPKRPRPHSVPILDYLTVL